MKALFFSFVFFVSSVQALTLSLDEKVKTRHYLKYNELVLEVTNDNAIDVSCEYRITWFAGITRYREFFGTITMAKSSEDEFRFQDETGYPLSRVKVRVFNCNVTE